MHNSEMDMNEVMLPLFLMCRKIEWKDSFTYYCLFACLKGEIDCHLVLFTSFFFIIEQHLNNISFDRKVTGQKIKSLMFSVLLLVF